MKIALAFMPVWDHRTPPLGLAYLQASLRQAGIPCQVMDYTREFHSIMLSARGDESGELYIADHPEGQP